MLQQNFWLNARGARWLAKLQPYLRPTLTAVLILGIVLPPIYLIGVIQYSAILYPYWDEVTLVPVFAAYFDGRLSFADLDSWSSQAHPVVPRIIFLLNAIATDWDIRSEYTFIYLTIFGLLALHLYAIHKLSTGLPKLPFLVLGLIISILICSPVGHHTHWYSLMLILTLCNLFAAAALFTVAFRPDSWTANVVAALFGWLSAYSTSLGLFLFPVILITHQLASCRPLIPTKFGLFWLINLIVLYKIYLPGLPGVQHPTLSQYVEFFFIYLGSPIASLFKYRVGSQFNPDLTTITPGYYGFALLAASIFLAYKALPDLRARRPEAFILILFSGFAVLAAIVTGWGRAAEFGVANANASRYSIFAVYLTLGLIYYLVTHFARERVDLARVPVVGALLVVGVCAFVYAAASTYVRALSDYRTAHDMNDWLSEAYASPEKPTDLDIRVYPDLDYYNAAKATMLRLGIGPYRSLPSNIVDLTSTTYARAIPLEAGHKISQRVAAKNAMLKSISMQLVTWAQVPTRYTAEWKVFALAQGSRVQIGAGTISTSIARDWQTIRMARLSAPDFRPEEYEIEFSAPQGQDSSRPIGLPLHTASQRTTAEPASVDGKPADDGAVLGLRLRFAG